MWDAGPFHRVRADPEQGVADVPLAGLMSVTGVRMLNRP